MNKFSKPEIESELIDLGENLNDCFYEFIEDGKFKKFTSNGIPAWSIEIKEPSAKVKTSYNTDMRIVNSLIKTSSELLNFYKDIEVAVKRANMDNIFRIRIDYVVHSANYDFSTLIKIEFILNIKYWKELRKKYGLSTDK